MFLGTTPAVISQFLVSELQRRTPARIFVPFAGNFVIEQIARVALPNIDIHSTDVSLYSRAIGFAFTGQSFDVAVRPEVLDRFVSFRDRTDPLDLAAIVIFFAEVAQNLRKNDKAYYRSINDHAVECHLAYFDKIRTKLAAVSSVLTGMQFYGTDAVPILDSVPVAGDAVYYDPPLYKNGYEKMFAPLDDIFTYTPEPYTNVDEAVIEHQLSSLDERDVAVYYGTNVDTPPLPGRFDEILSFQYDYHRHWHVFSNARDRTFVGRWKALTETQAAYRLIDTSCEITSSSSIHVVRVPGKVANHYRLMWVKKAEMKSADYAYLVVVDDRVTWVIQLSSGQNLGIPYAVIFADPPAPTSRYRRLSKLVLRLCLTQQMLDIFNNDSLWEHEQFTTVAFTDHPVSMKYRALFDLASRDELEEGNNRYKLTYRSKTLLPTFEDALMAWLKQDAKHVDAPGS